MDVYAAGEEPIPEVSADKLAAGISGHGHKSCVYAGSAEATVEHLRNYVAAGDIVITLGAGNVWQVGEELLDALTNKN